jgi:hypothetical protein
MMHEKVSAHRQRVTKLADLGTQNIRVEQAQVGPRVEGRADLVQYAALDQQAEPAQVRVSFTALEVVGPSYSTSDVTSPLLS